MSQEEKSDKTGKRLLKVCAKFFPRAYHQYAKFPEIRIAGKWVEDSGFGCGAIVMVHHEKNKITITLEKAPDPPDPNAIFRG